jgi:uncharacterized protein YndB with AHSA1/START domain
MKIILRKAASSLFFLAAAVAVFLPGAARADRVLRAELVLDAPVGTLWKLWTTEAGVTSFFAPGCHIEPKVDGAFEIFFNPAAPPGEKGGEGMRIVAFEENARLAFTWSAPPSQPAIRGQRTVVEVRFVPQGPAKTKVVFTHDGWGDGPDWDAAYGYFDKAWNTFVLPHFAWRVANGPIDWKKPPEVKPWTDSLKLELVPKR